MGATLSRRDQVHVAFLQQVAAFRQPVQGPVDPFGFAGHGAAEGLLRNGFPTGGVDREVVFETVFVVPLGAVFGVRGVEDDFQARTQHGFGAQ